MHSSYQVAQEACLGCKIDTLCIEQVRLWADRLGSQTHLVRRATQLLFKLRDMWQAISLNP